MHCKQTPATMRRLLCSVFFLYLIKGGWGVSERVVRVLPDTEAQFCVTVETTEGYDLDPKEQIIWKSRPQMSMYMNVITYAHQEFEGQPCRYRFNSSTLGVGPHNVRYFYTVNDLSKQHLLTVYVDDVRQEPTRTERFLTTDSTFTNVTIYAKGPLNFSWNDTCPVTTEAPTTTSSQSPTTSSQSLTAFSQSPAASITPPPTPVTSPAAVDPSSGGTHSLGAPSNITGGETEESAEEKDLEHERVVNTWIILCACLAVAVLVMVGAVYFFYRHNTKQKIARNRRTEAERQKQVALHDASRLSYIEQTKWAESCVDQPLTATSRP